MKRMIVFPGQGAQFKGMGKDLFDNSAAVRDIFRRADEALGFSLSDICFNGPEEKLTLTKYAQPAILTVSYAAWKAMEEKVNINNIEFMAGHSLGEYTALVASGALEFEEAVRTVFKRGEYMQNAVAEGKGSMAAVLNAPREKIYKVCDESGHLVSPANFNSPRQVVVSGLTEGVDFVVSSLKKDRIRAKKLKVSAPFHSKLMKPAAENMISVLNTMTVNKMKYPVISNVTAQPAARPDDIRDLLAEQITAAVRWDDSVVYARKKGIDEIVEIGPGKVLSGLARHIDREISTKNISSWEDIKSVEFH